jgi:putative redox protein
VEKCGGDAGFGPHELLEAALASCLNIYVRVCAKNQDIPLAGVVTEVTMERQAPEGVVFRYGLELKGPLTEEQRWALIQAAQSCPVHQILAGKISFTCLPA